MPSVKNPNMASKNRLAARASSAKKKRQQASEAGKNKIAKIDARRGGRPGLMPTSGPQKPTSSKKQRKLDKKMGYALKRKMAAEGEVEMKDAPVGAGGDTKLGAESGMEVDGQIA